MGVTGLWTVLQPCARPIKIETLNKKRLAVDASIWIYQFLKAVRDKEGNALRNSHIVGFFRRVCKLLFIGIKPVFVFDGGAPALKRKTISSRKSRREGRREDAVRTASKLLAIQMQRAAEEEQQQRRQRQKEAAEHPREQREEIPEELVYADEILQTAQERKQNRSFKKKDQYHLPDLNVPMNEMGGANDPRIMSLEELEEYARLFDKGEDINVYDFSKIDFDGYFFHSLPAADRYNILNAARLRSRLRMGHSKEQLDAMFPDRMAFSKFQIERVRERNDLTQRLMNLNGMNDDALDARPSRRVAGERDREYVLVKNDGVEGGWALGVVTNKEEGKAHKPINVDLPQPLPQEDKEWEDEDDFEDVPVEGLNRLPKPKHGLSAEERKGREFIAQGLATRRRNLYKSRKHTSPQIAPQKTTSSDPNSLFLAEDEAGDVWESVPVDGGEDSSQGLGDQAEEDQLQQAIALSLQPPDLDVSIESEDDPVHEVFQQKRAVDTNPFVGTQASGLAIARLANQRSSKLAVKGPFEGSDSDEDMDPRDAPAESHKMEPPTRLVRQSAPMPTRTASSFANSAPSSSNAPKFDGPLPFEKLNLGSSILGKKKMEKIMEDTSGGFEKNYEEDKQTARPLPPWFNGGGNIEKDLLTQREEAKQEWGKAKAEDRAHFQFQDVPGLRKQDVREIIDLEAPTAQSQEQAILLESDEEEEEASEREGSTVKMAMKTTDDVADELRTEPPEPFSPQALSSQPEPSVFRKATSADHSGDDPVEWSESEVEEEQSPPTEEHGSKVEDSLPQRSRSPSEEFEDVPIHAGSSTALDPSEVKRLQYEETVVDAKQPQPPRRESTPLRLEGPDDLLKPIEPHEGVADENSLLEMAENESDQYSDPEDAELFASLAAEAEEHARFAQELSNNTASRIDFEQELKQLRAQQKKDRRDADEVTQTMISECQHLLGLFGLPYITAPMEAEAQCAELVHLGLVDGIVTDDSDTFLFGGTRVYKNMFNAAKYVECYLEQDLVSEFSLSRDRLIAIAQLLGSDYTTGIPGIGPVTALEILSEFSDLQSFREWWDGVQANTVAKDKDAKNAFRRRFRRGQATKLFLPSVFPDPMVAEAYLHPEVDSSPEPFQWGVPDLAALRAFLSAQIGWSRERTDEVLVPVIRDMNRREKEGTQANITRFFEGSVGAGAFAPRVKNSSSGPLGKRKGTRAAGKRLGAALSRLAAREGARGGAEDEEEEEEEEEEEKEDGSNDDSKRLDGDGPAVPAHTGQRNKRKASDDAAFVSMSVEDDSMADGEGDDLYKPAPAESKKSSKKTTNKKRKK